VWHRANKDETYEIHLKRQREWREYYDEIQAKRKVYREAKKPKENRRKILYYLNNDSTYANRIKPATMQKLENGKYIWTKLIKSLSSFLCLFCP
jgi:CRISPR/Cas system-associated exonuclease Cas4 (RecB family)